MDNNEEINLYSENLKKIRNVLNLSVKSEVPLRSVGYAWNSDDFQYASAKQGTEFEMTINVIEGENNKLNIAIVDMLNKKTISKMRNLKF